MVDRLLEWIEPQRRHLGLLVALLVLTFVLTVMLAFNARQADLARRQQAQLVLRDLVAQASSQWANETQDRFGIAVQSSMHQALQTLVRDAVPPFDSLVSAIRTEDFCASCDAAVMRDPTFFDVDLRTGTMQTRGSGMSRELLESVQRLASGKQYTLVHDHVGVAVVFEPADEGFQAAAVTVQLDDAGLPARALGYTLTPALVRETLALLFNNLILLPHTLSKGLPNDSFFAIRASHRGVSILPSVPGSTFVATDTVDVPPVNGLVLQVGIRENASTKLLIAGAMSSSLPLLLTLMFCIAGLTVLALILVRREAELVRLRADFVSGVSHELRTPLAQIRMFTETLLLGRIRSDVERRRSLEIIDQEARRLGHLVENVLLFARSEGGRTLPLKPEPTELAVETLRAVESFGPLCRTRGAEIRAELQERVTADVDRCALRQIMLNLIENALKYGPAGQRITVGLGLFEDEARIWVDDEGPGIPAAERDQIFESFYRLPRDVASRSSGSGIGLAVVRELARLHGGEVTALTAPGGGARLLVRLPNARLKTQSAAGLAAAS
jgi:signal transduction histidine kinase